MSVAKAQIESTIICDLRLYFSTIHDFKDWFVTYCRLEKDCFLIQDIPQKYRKILLPTRKTAYVYIHKAAASKLFWAEMDVPAYVCERTNVQNSLGFRSFRTDELPYELKNKFEFGINKAFKTHRLVKELDEQYGLGPECRALMNAFPVFANRFGVKYEPYVRRMKNRIPSEVAELVKEILEEHAFFAALRNLSA
ncbi:MAG: hypothetical protein QW318_07740 [Candidatus Caldarchaeum sp.]